jgi:hypothetical protein
VAGTERLIPPGAEQLSWLQIAGVPVSLTRGRRRLHYGVDNQTQELTPKLSAEFVREAARQNAVV